MSSFAPGFFFLIKYKGMIDARRRNVLLLESVILWDLSYLGKVQAKFFFFLRRNGERSN